jgi:hypothetical protein
MNKKLDLNDPKAKEQIQEYILLMLGAPIVRVELDKQQLDLCINRTCDFMGLSSRVSKWEEPLRLLVAQEGALAHAKLILGRIRAKYSGLLDVKGVKSKSKSTCSNSPVDGLELLHEGEREYQSWRQRVFGKIEGKINGV